MGWASPGLLRVGPDFLISAPAAWRRGDTAGTERGSQGQPGRLRRLPRPAPGWQRHQPGRAVRGTPGPGRGPGGGSESTREDGP
jgi:hypothetical protein